MSFTLVSRSIDLQTSETSSSEHGNMEKRKREREDDEDRAPTQAQMSGAPVLSVFTGDSVLTRYTGMTARWSNGSREHWFTNVDKITEFGGKLTVQTVNGHWLFYPKIDVDEPLLFAGDPAAVRA
jgi:hypothetical protein